MWGEGPAGFEWQIELETALHGLGWRRAENVPTCWTYRESGHDAILVTIVDDLLFIANFHVATGVGCPSRSKHFLRRYFVLKRRIAEGEVTMRHVPDEQMPADCLTKFGISKDKLKRSVDYMTNRRATPHPPLPEASLGKVQTTEALTAAIDALSPSTGP